MSRSTLVALATLAALQGCSLGGDEKPAPPQGAAKEVARTVLALDRATRSGDWRAVCKRLFTRSARRRSGGSRCPRLLAENARGISRPRITVTGIEIRGKRARARVRSRATGQPPLRDVIELRRVGRRYLIDSLSD